MPPVSPLSSECEQSLDLITQRMVEVSVKDDVIGVSIQIYRSNYGEVWEVGLITHISDQDDFTEILFNGHGAPDLLTVLSLVESNLAQEKRDGR
jgi:hypothetical protein